MTDYEKTLGLAILFVLLVYCIEQMLTQRTLHSRDCFRGCPGNISFYPYSSPFRGDWYHPHFTDETIGPKEVSNLAKLLPGPQPRQLGAMACPRPPRCPWGLPGGHPTPPHVRSAMLPLRGRESLGLSSHMQENSLYFCIFLVLYIRYKF